METNPPPDRNATAAPEGNEITFREIVENTQQVFYVGDAHGRVLYVSPAFETLLGYPADRLYEHPQAWLELIHPEDRPRVTEALAKSRSTGAFELEYRVMRADGAVRWLSARSTEVRGPDGAVHRVVGTATDITQNRELEEQLRQSQKMEAIGQLAGGIAHDFNNLLTVIVGNAAMLRENADPRGPLAEQLEEIQNAARRAAELTKKLLGFSRQAVLNLKPVALGRIAAEAAALIRPTFGARIVLRLELAETGDVVLGDQAELLHVVMNLCLNARDAMAGGGRLTLETGRSVIDAAHAARVPGGRTGELSYLSVADTGTGIEAEVLPRIFDPFFTTKPVGKGTGLGLAVAFGIVKQHEGFIECGTSRGVGTRFTIFLPPAARAPETRPAESPGPAPSASGENILFVDDEAPIRALARKVLEGHGYRVRLAADGAEAVAAFDRGGTADDLVIVDLTMPGLTGLEVVERLRSARPNVRIILSTGHGGEEARAIEHDARIAVLRKPYTVEALLRMTRRVLDGTP